MRCRDGAVRSTGGPRAGAATGTAPGMTAQVSRRELVGDGNDEDERDDGRQVAVGGAHPLLGRLLLPLGEVFRYIHMNVPVGPEGR